MFKIVFRKFIKELLTNFLNLEKSFQFIKYMQYEKKIKLYIYILVFVLKEKEAKPDIFHRFWINWLNLFVCFKTFWRLEF